MAFGGLPISVAPPPTVDPNAIARSAAVVKFRAPRAARSGAVSGSATAPAATPVASGIISTVVAVLLTNALTDAAAMKSAPTTNAGRVPAAFSIQCTKCSLIPWRSSAMPSTVPPAKRKITLSAYDAATSLNATMPRTGSSTAGISAVTARSAACVIHQSAIHARRPSVIAPSAVRPPCAAPAGCVHHASAAPAIGPAQRPMRAAVPCDASPSLMTEACWPMQAFSHADAARAPGTCRTCIQRVPIGVDTTSAVGISGHRIASRCARKSVGRRSIQRMQS